MIKRHLCDFVFPKDPACESIMKSQLETVFVTGAAFTPRVLRGCCVYSNMIIGIYISVNYNDLTATSLESWPIREVSPKCP